MAWKVGDRFSYIRMCGGWGHGTVLTVDGDIVTGRLDCQKEGETYRFRASDRRFFRDETEND